ALSMNLVLVVVLVLVIEEELVENRLRRRRGRFSGSRSQCMRTSERGLSMNLSSSSQSDEPMVAVGFSPRTAELHTVGRRGATPESRDRQHSGVAPRRSSFIEPRTV